MSSYGAGDPPRPLSRGLPGHTIDDPRMMGVGGIDPGMGGKSRSMGFGGGRSEMSLPPDASNTLFVEGLPGNCTRREVSRILFSMLRSFHNAFILLWLLLDKIGESSLLCIKLSHLILIDFILNGILYPSFSSYI